jgi:hypothetical protein
MKNLTQKEIKSIQQIAISQYKENMQKEGKSKTPEYFANALMLNYSNAIIEDGLVTGYYNNGCKNIPLLPKYL